MKTDEVIEEILEELARDEGRARTRRWACSTFFKRAAVAASRGGSRAPRVETTISSTTSSSASSSTSRSSAGACSPGACAPSAARKKTGRGVEFADHRDYAAGRRLPLPRLERLPALRSPALRLYEEEEDLTIYFIVDCSRVDGLRRRREASTTRKRARGGARLRRAREPRPRDASSPRPTRSSSACRRRAARRASSRCSASCASSSRRARPTSSDSAARRSWRSTSAAASPCCISDLYDPAGFERGINVLRYNKFEPFVLHIVDRERGAARSSRATCASTTARPATSARSPSPPKVLERYGARLRRVPRRDRALLHLAAGAVLPRRREHAVRRAHPARLPARRVPALMHALRRPAPRDAARRSAASPAALVVVFYILKLRRRPVPVPFSQHLGADPARQGGDEPVLAAQAPALAARCSSRCSRCSLLALGDPRTAASLDQGRNLVVLSTPAPRCRRPTSTPHAARRRRRTR